MKEDNVSQGSAAVSDSHTYPTAAKIQELYEEYQVPINIQQHCMAVAKVVVVLAKKLREAGVDIDISFSESLALVHDLFKHVVLSELKEDARFDAPAPTEKELAKHKELREQFKGKYETEIGFELFKDTFPFFAQSLVNQSYGKVVITWEEKIVRYVDYITFSHNVIGLESRLKDIEERYHKTDLDKQALWEVEKKKMRDLQEEIFSHLDITPEKLMELVNDG